MSGSSSIELAADAALPHRDTLLDPGAMRERLAPLLDKRERVQVASLEIARVSYHPGRSLRAVYHAEIDGVSRTIAAHMFTDAARSESVYRGSLPHARPVASREGVAHDAAVNTVFWMFPNDRRIASLEAIADPARTRAAIDARPVVSTRLVAYAPEKAATFVCESADRAALAYLKVTADDQAGEDGRTYTRLRSGLDPQDAALRLPAPLDYSSPHRALWLEAIVGRRLATSLGGDGEIADLERLGAAVAVFHRLDGGPAPRFDRCSPATLAADAEMIRAIRPDAAGAAERLRARLTAAIAIDADVGCLHGDLHPKNAIVCADRIALIDVESVAIGPAAADMGSLLAGLVYRRETGRLTALGCRSRAIAFLAGYARRRRLPARDSLVWHTAAALLRERAIRAVTRIRPHGLQALPALLSAADRLLDRGLEAL